MPVRFTDGLAANTKTPTAKAMKTALTEYSNAIGVPDVFDSQPASGMPAMPMSPLQVASARRAMRRNESLDCASFGVLMAVMKLPFLLGETVPEPTPQPLTTAAPDRSCGSHA